MVMEPNVYVTPPIGTVLLAVSNLNPDGTIRVPNPGPVQHLPADGLNEWLQAQAQDTAYKQNAVIAQEYTAYFNDSWLLNYKEGRIEGPKGMGDPDAEPPEPPDAKVVVVKTAEAGGVRFDIQDSGQQEDVDGYDTGPSILVCEVPPYEKIPAPQHQQPEAKRKGKK